MPTEQMVDSHPQDRCPMCAQDVRSGAVICPYCHTDIASGRHAAGVRLSVWDGVKLGTGMFVILPVLIILVLFLLGIWRG